MREAEIAFLVVGLAVTSLDEMTGAPPSISVHIYNYAEVPEPILSESVAYATRVLQHAGITSEWIDIPLNKGLNTIIPTAQPNSTRLILRLLPKSMMAKWANDQKNLGFSIIPAETYNASISGVYFHRVSDLAIRLGMRRRLVLGIVIVHELGHLLLGARSHSRQGIMSFPLTHNEIVEAAQDTLHFSSTQIEVIHQQLAIRSRMSTTPQTTVAQGGTTPE